MNDDTQYSFNTDCNNDCSTPIVPLNVNTDCDKLMDRALKRAFDTIEQLQSDNATLKVTIEGLGKAIVSLTKKHNHTCFDN